MLVHGVVSTILTFLILHLQLGLKNQYIGDGYPLCSDLPNQHYLMTGAKYRFLGGDSTPELLTERWDWGSPKRFKVSTSSGSELAAKLCNDPTSSGTCNFQPMVVLDVDLGCSGIECGIDDPRVIEIDDGVFFEYVRPPCVGK